MRDTVNFHQAGTSRVVRGVFRQRDVVGMLFRDGVHVIRSVFAANVGMAVHTCRSGLSGFSRFQYGCVVSLDIEKGCCSIHRVDFGGITSPQTLEYVV